MSIGNSFEKSSMNIKFILLVSIMCSDKIHCHPLYRLNLEKLKHLAGINTPLNNIEDTVGIGNKIYATNKPSDKCCVEHEEPNVRDNGETKRSWRTF